MRIREVPNASHDDDAAEEPSAQLVPDAPQGRGFCARDEYCDSRQLGT